MADREKLIELLDVIGSCNAKYCADCEFGNDIAAEIHAHIKM